MKELITDTNFLLTLNGNCLIEPMRGKWLQNLNSSSHISTPSKAKMDTHSQYEAAIQSLITAQNKLKGLTDLITI